MTTITMFFLAQAEYVDIFAEYIEAPMSRRGGSFKRKMEDQKRRMLNGGWNFNKSVENMDKNI